MLYSKSKIKNKTFDDLKLIIQKCIEFCRLKLGFCKDIPSVILSRIKQKKGNKTYGYYDPYENNIVVMINECKTLSELTSLIIHEYTHTLQPILKKYQKLYKKHGYENHPFEIEANTNEKLWNRKLLNYLRKEIV
jgi:hypothetical protein